METLTHLQSILKKDHFFSLKQPFQQMLLQYNVGYKIYYIRFVLKISMVPVINRTLVKEIGEYFHEK